MTTRIASFDIGKKNFAWVVEDTPNQVLEELRLKYAQLPKKKQRRVKGVMNDDIARIHQRLFEEGRVVQISLKDLRPKHEDKLTMEVRRNLFEHLEQYLDLWASCDVIVIEQQFFSTFTKARGGGANIDALKLGETVLTWFMLHFPDKEVVSFGSQFKTQMLGAPYSETKTKPKRKAWSEKKAQEILDLRGDTQTRAKYKQLRGRKQKLDDVSDCLLMGLAYKYRHRVACF